MPLSPGPRPTGLPTPLRKTPFPVKLPFLLQGAQEGFCYLPAWQLLHTQLEKGEKAQMQTGKLGGYIKSTSKTRKLPVTRSREVEAVDQRNHVPVAGLL